MTQPFADAFRGKATTPKDRIYDFAAPPLPGRKAQSYPPRTSSSTNAPICDPRAGLDFTQFPRLDDNSQFILKKEGPRVVALGF
jgi:hypothetical protein